VSQHDSNIRLKNPGKIGKKERSPAQGIDIVDEEKAPKSLHQRKGPVRLVRHCDRISAAQISGLATVAKGVEWLTMLET
jgi:hypothetical protein